MGLLSALPGIRRALADPDLALDLGTANTRVCSSRRALIVDEPSVVGVSADAGSTRTVRPLQSGVIADVDAAA